MTEHHDPASQASAPSPADDGVDPVVEQAVTGLPQQEPSDDADDQERQHEGAGHHPCLDGAAPEGERGHPSAAQAVPAL